MSQRIRRQLTYTNVVGTLALFFALGGISYAAVAVKKNSVGTKELRKNAVRGAKVKNGSLIAADVKGRLAPGPTGAQGAKGPTGDQGIQGTSSTAKTRTVLSGRTSLINANQLFAVSGESVASGDETLVNTLSPAVQTTARDLFIRLDTAPGVGATRAFTVRFNNMITMGLGCSISGAATSCTAPGPLILPANTRISIGGIAAGVPAPTEMTFGVTIGSP